MKILFLSYHKFYVFPEIFHFASKIATLYSVLLLIRLSSSYLQKTVLLHPKNLYFPAKCFKRNIFTINSRGKHLQGKVLVEFIFAVKDNKNYKNFWNFKFIFKVHTFGANFVELIFVFFKIRLCFFLIKKIIKINKKYFNYK